MNAKAKGIQFGRKRSIDRNKIIELYATGVGATDIAKQTGICRSTVYNLL
jgi:DNA invertase Pin-like site-specific DNA recombinase